MKKILGILIVICLVVLVFSLATAEPAKTPVRVASLKGPTSLGLVKLMTDQEGKADYTFMVAGTADEIAPLLATGDLDIALIPCNLASVLYQKLNGSLRMTAISTLGVLYIIENGDSIHEVADLRGQTMLSMGKGTTPEYALNYVLSQNGINPESDLTIEYKSEATEVAALLGQDVAKIAMLPQPYVTAVLAQNPDLRMALSLTEAWNEVSPSSALITGAIVMRKAFMDERPDEAQAFMRAYAESAAYVNEHPKEVAPAIEELGIAKAEIAEKAIPLCNIVCITGDEMREKTEGYLKTLYEQNPASVGGNLPDEAFYAPAASAE